MIHKDSAISLTVTENRPEFAGYRSIVFERPVSFAYESGDWIDIKFGELELKGGQTYSLSSSPTEPDLMITFKDGISEIKKALAGLRPQDKLSITQYGNDYTFTLQPHKTVTLIAGGVGVAPFRSMIKEMVDVQSNNQVHLLYLGKTTEFLFEPELVSWMKQLPSARMTRIVTGGMKKKERTKALLEAMQDLGGTFYIAGSESMVEDTEHLLINKGVEIKNIKIDSFGGY